MNKKQDFGQNGFLMPASGAAKPKVLLLDFWKTIARGPHPEPIEIVKGDILKLGDNIRDSDFLKACLTTPHEKPRAYLQCIARRFNATVPKGAVAEFEELVDLEKNGLLLFIDAHKDGVLSRLKQRMRLGLVTNCWPFPLRTFLQSTGLDEIFEHVISSHETGVCKQYGPSIYRLAAEKFDVSPAECRMIGDNPQLDVLTPVQAGVPAVLLDRFGEYVRGGTYADPLLAECGMPFIRNLNDLEQLLP